MSSRACAARYCRPHRHQHLTIAADDIVKNGGREWRPKGSHEQVRVHDFVIPKLGRLCTGGGGEGLRRCQNKAISILLCGLKCNGDGIAEALTQPLRQLPKLDFRICLFVHFRKSFDSISYEAV
jgi:hypothetical protein